DALVSLERAKRRRSRPSALGTFRHVRSRFLAAAAVLPILAACAGGSQETATDGEDPSLTWETRYEDGTVAVRLEDESAHYRVDRVVLLDPDGQTIPSTE